MRIVLIAFAFWALTSPVQARADAKGYVVSRGASFDVRPILKEDSTTIVLFMQDTSSMEQQFLADLEKELGTDGKVALRLVRLKNVDAPAARQYGVKQTPTAIVYDRFGNILARTSQPDEIKAAIRKGRLMGRIKWIDEDDPKAPEVYGMPAAALKRGLPGIVKTAGLRPDVFKMFNIMSTIHFSDGFLKRREHEMVAAYVSGLNKCKF
jgi:hypothetical protein